MVRPKKARFVDGVQLADNLYPDNKGRKGHFRYLKPDGTFKHFVAESVHEANKSAESANDRRDAYGSVKKKKPNQTIMSAYVEDFIEYRQIDSPGLKKKDSWRNRCYALRQFGREISIPFSRLKRQHIEDWWLTQSFHQQKSRHAEFRKLFNYLMGRGVLPLIEHNPFTTQDDKPRFYVREAPARSKERLTLTGFWQVYPKAGELGYEGLQIAMGLSLVTFMREQDILALKINEHIQEDLLKKVIRKSAAQKGHTKAARLKWDTNTHKLVKQLINRGRELSMKNMRCPYLVSHMPRQRRLGKTKDHICQLTPKRLQEMFNEARDATGYWNDLPPGKKPPTFHEVRSLGDVLASNAGYDLETIQHAMAQSDASQTLLYQANHDLPYEDSQVIFTAEQLGGDFSD